MWVVDTCVLLDILDNHPVFGMKSADALDAVRGLITRNEDDFRTLYPSLRIYNPISK